MDILPYTATRKHIVILPPFGIFFTLRSTDGTGSVFISNDLLSSPGCRQTSIPIDSGKSYVRNEKDDHTHETTIKYIK